jgi:hypothetical protein
MATNAEYLGQIRRLVAYFRRQIPNGLAGSEKGLLAAEAWVRYLERRHQPERVIDLDLLVLEGEGETGSGWIELRTLYEAWRHAV